MKRLMRLGLVALTCMLAWTAHSPAAEPLVVGHDLQKLRAPGISAVLWTRRTNTYTLQVIFPSPGRLGGLPPANAPRPTGAASLLPYPDIRAWVLHANGAALSPVRRYAATGLKATPVARGAPDREQRSEILYEFDLATGAEAVAVAISVNGEFFIEKMSPL